MQLGYRPDRHAQVMRRGKSGIIAILASLLLPALQNAREQGKKAVCMSNMRQIHVVLMTYADDNNEWLPPVHWGDGTTFQYANNAVGSPNPAVGGWMTRFFPNTRILRCPAMDPDITTDGSVYWGGPGRDKYYWTTYRILAGTANHDPGVSKFFGWSMYNPSRTDLITRAPCPNLKFLGQSVTGYGFPNDLWVDGIYVDTADKQPAVIDAYNRDSGRWGQYGRSSYIDSSNHDRLDGENIVFVDGHGEWRTATQVQPRFQLPGPQQWAYW